MGSLVDGNTTIESVLEDKLEEGEIREVEEENTLQFLNSPSYFCDLEEGEIRKEKVDEENMVHVLNSPAYFDDLEEGEIREERHTSYAVVPWDQHVTTVMELPPSKVTTVREKERLENHAKTAAILRYCHGERESEETDPVKDHAKGHRDISLARQVEEVYNKRSSELLSLQDLELKKFKLLKKVHELEFVVNCSGKLSIQDFKILCDKFDKHMRAQHRTFRTMLIEARNKERNLKELWLEKVREGTLEGSFCEMPLPATGFKMENFDFGSEMEDVLVQNGSCPSDGMHLDVVEDEGCSGSEDLHEARVESDHMMNDVSHSNDNLLDAMCVQPKFITKSPSISSPSSNFVGEEMPGEKNEIGCNETAVGVPETLARNLNPDPSQVIIPNSNFVCDEVTLEEHEPACTNTASIGLAEANTQNPISDISSLPRNVNSDQIVVTDPTSHPSTRSQVYQYPAINLPYSSNVTTPTNLSLSPGRNDIAEAPLVNQNEAPVEQSATQILTRDGDIVTQLLQMVCHDMNIDPLQNELNTVRNLQKMLTERHNEKIAQLRAEYERELDNTRRKYHQMEVEADAQWSDHRAHLNMVYQKVCMNLRLAKDFQDMFNSPNLTGIEGREQFRQSCHPEYNPNPILRPASHFGARPLSSSNYGLIPNPYATPQVRQPQVTFSGAPPVLPMQSPQYCLNQPNLLHPTLARTPIGGPGLGGVCRPGLPQFNQLRPSSLSTPAAEFRYI